MEYKKKDFKYYCRKIWFDYICDWFDSFRKKCRSVKYKIKYLFFPNNVLKIKTLPRHWMDRDEVMLHACFQILCDYVERECNNEYHALTPINIEKDMESYKEWDAESQESMRKGLIEQNRITQEILDLYNWWKKRKETRNKNDPLNETDSLPDNDSLLDCSEVVKRDEYGDPVLWELKMNTSPERKAIYARSHQYEIDCDKEDEDMLIRLMKIRKNLWT